MAQTPEGYLLNGQAELAEQTMRSLELKGDLPQLVDPRIQLGVQVDDWTKPEYRWTRRMGSFMRGELSGAVAAQFSYVIFGSLTVASRTLAAVDSAIISNPGAAAVQVQFGLIDSALFAPASFTGIRDDRMYAGGVTTRAAFGTQSVQNVTALLTTGNPAVYLAPGTSMRVPLEVVLTNKPSGTAGQLIQLAFQNSIVLSGLAVSVFWRERALLTTELT